MHASDLFLVTLLAAGLIYAGYIYWKAGSLKGRDPYDKKTWK